MNSKNSKKNFALIGAGGYIAPRHVEAIKHTNNDLVALLDPYDGVGYIDKHFPEASYFKEAERFDRHLYRNKDSVDYVSICSPNYLHDAHIRLSLRNGCDVICEKPLVLRDKHLQSLKTLEKETGKKIYNILQLRHHPLIKELKEKYKDCSPLTQHEVTLDYITPRGVWYDYSWKGDSDKSGGVVTNIGVHFFDMLIWIFGDVIAYQVETTGKRCKGTLHLKNAKVTYNLSIMKEDLPWDEWKPFRSIKINGEELEFSTGFTELHKISYEEILKGNGFTLEDVEPTIKLIDGLRQKEVKLDGQTFYI
jgi:UDP-N-acetyl-2-amino-2-deoxyglucuronate dehydrogenase